MNPIPCHMQYNSDHSPTPTPHPPPPPPPRINPWTVALAVLGCFRSVLSCFYCEAQPISKRKIPSNNKLESASKISPVKKPVNKYKPGAYYNFTVLILFIGFPRRSAVGSKRSLSWLTCYVILGSRPRSPLKNCSCAQS